MAQRRKKKEIPKDVELENAGDDSSYSDDDLGNVAPIRKVQPGDLLDVVRKIRRLMAENDTAAFTLYASFEELGGKDTEEAAIRARRATELAATRLYQLLGAVERLPAFVNMRREALKRNKIDDEEGLEDD